MSVDTVHNVPEPRRPIRVISATRRENGAAVFNQAVMVQDEPPNGLFLVAVDQSAGLKLWMKPFAVVEPETRSQAAGYSRNLRINVDEPPGVARSARRDPKR